MIICYILLFIFINSFILLYRYKSNIEKYIEKIELLNNKIQELKIKSYYNIFKIIRHIFTHFKPETISLYLYNYRKDLKITTINFLYQIKNKGNEPDIIFTGDHNNVPITNIDIITKSYFNNDVCLMTNIKELSKYDNGLYQRLKKDGINKLYLVNIYNEDICEHREKDCIKNKPIGFFSLTYKDKILTEKERDLLKKEIQKISEYLANIIS
jgi:hypothetical protein